MVLSNFFDRNGVFRGLGSWRNFRIAALVRRLGFERTASCSHSGGVYLAAADQQGGLCSCLQVCVDLPEIEWP